ncbi:MAG: hypothetical protein COS42_04430 [Flavobacteriales bacterium CG03_land_8_20_14_0_80_35_15]|nr:MAG: hypothetical protein COS42_04430 [Flavobacteriales bacterium CG03_land_8_20_14_0_80_35_15]
MKKILFFLGALLSFVTHAQNPGDVAQSFGPFPGSGFNATVNAIALQADGKIFVGGWFNSYNGVTENYLIRLNANGTKDATFNTGTGFNAVVRATALQTDGKILVGGSFTSYNGVTENHLIRLNADGTKDATFSTGTGFNAIVFAIALQADGKILVGGFFTAYNGVTENHLIRLNADGTKDATFNTGTGFNAFVRAIVPQADGKILVGGGFNSYNGVTENRIIRLNADGTKDATFNTGTGFNNWVNAIAPQADGKILVGGQFTSYNGVSENHLIRLNANGTKDTTFNTGTGFDNIVNAIAPQADGKILVGGQFTSYNGVTENGIIPLNADGTKDAAFNTGTGFNAFVMTIAPQVNGKILVGGAFSSYNSNNSSAMLIALYTGNVLSINEFTNSNTIALWPNPTKAILNINSLFNDTISIVKIYDLQGKLVMEFSNNSINVSALSNGLYFVKIVTDKGEQTKKFLKE